MSNLKDNLLTIYKTPKDSVKVKSKLKEDIYDELTIKTVSSLISFISQYTPINHTKVFYDIGSGLGKIPLHVLNVTTCQKVVGVEKNKDRCKISKDLFKKMKGLKDKRLKIINDNILNIKEFGDINYLNDLNFPAKYTSHVWDHLKQDSLLITHKKIGSCYPIDRMLFRMEGKKDPFWGLIYRKPNTLGGVPSRLGLKK